MLKIEEFRENPEKVRKNTKKRSPERLKYVRQVIEADEKWRKARTKLDNLRHEHNELTQKIGKLKQKGKDVEEEIKKAEEKKKEIEKLEEKTEKLYRKREKARRRVPNYLHPEVPVGESEEDNEPIRYWGEKPKFDFEPKDQIELLKENDLADFKRAAKVAGARFYFLKGKLVDLEWAILRLALDYMKKQGFKPLRTPHMMNKEALRTAIDFKDFEDMIYKIKGKDRYMIATAEHPMTAMHMNETLLEEELPKKYVAWSACFRKEAGTHGKFSKGLYRLHDFLKVEQYVICKPENSWKWHERLTRNHEAILKKLKIPYRIVDCCTGDIGTVAARKYDAEAWMPAYERYGEVASCSNCLSFQAVEAGIKYREEKGKPPKGYVHTLNNTVIAVPRTLIPVIENYQTKEGRIRVPKALQKYLDFKILP